jgi:endonuclease YncB( thermonuclease family)
VFLDGRNINAEMVEDGAAWVYRKYSRDPHLLELERQARAQGRGLWALQPDQRVPPWEWRKMRRSKRPRFARARTLVAVAGIAAITSGR